MDPTYTGNQIAQRRKALGLTQKDLAGQLHVTDKAVSKWERGVNFPDLGLMEALAAALDTTPARLLGLEEAERDEIVSSMSEISRDQLEAAQRDVTWLGWAGIAAAALLTAAYFLFGNDVRRTQTAYLLLHGGILMLAAMGLYLLIRYGQIKKFQRTDVRLLWATAAPILIHLGISFFTGYGPHPVLGSCLVAAAACMIQLLFCRVMAARPAKALPLILCGAFALWHLARGSLCIAFAIPAACCLAVWGLYHLRKPK